MRYNCLISSFYIKPQLADVKHRHHIIVLYRLSTSNHNILSIFLNYTYIVLYRLSTSNHNHILHLLGITLLSYIVFLHQTTTSRKNNYLCNHCLISSFYIKPQPACRVDLACDDCLISSFYIKPQHNAKLFPQAYYCLISSFYIKPQPAAYFGKLPAHCLISSFYIKPQPDAKAFQWQGDCLISSFYIKPQHICISHIGRMIVLYRLSTSNHNLEAEAGKYLAIVLYRLSTSNHNLTYIFF